MYVFRTLRRGAIQQLTNLQCGGAMQLIVRPRMRHEFARHRPQLC